MISSCLTCCRLAVLCLLLTGLLGVACETTTPPDPSPEAAPVDSNAVYLRVNLVGYLPDDTKVAVAFSHRPAEGAFALVAISIGTARCWPGWSAGCW